MAFRTPPIILRLGLILVLYAHCAHGSALLNDDFVTYELVDSQSKLDSEDSFLPDMVFVDTGKNVRLRRQLKSDANPSSPVSVGDDDKTKGSGAPKKVPSGFNTTSANSGKPTKFDGPSPVSGEKKTEKSPSSPKQVASITVETKESVPIPASTSSPITVAPPTIKNITAEKPSSNRESPAVKWSNVGHSGEHDDSHDGEVLESDVFPEEITNTTLAQQHVKNKTEDHHTYYNSSTSTVQDLSPFWVDMDSQPKAVTNTMLSQAHRRAATVALTFDFPFYGHLVKNVTIATGGFLYTGEYVHSWLAATQYIAPLMANFDTSLSKDSFVKYVDNVVSTAFTVEWCKVVLQDRPTQGNFSFQVTLHKSGDIVFVYKNVPVDIDEIKDDNHPVKVGLSDAYIIDRTIFFVRRKTIYEYHRVNFPNIRNGTVIYLRALPTCLDMKDCNSCLTEITNFECNWCPSARRCSNGMDRYRQDWLLKGCEPTDANAGKVKQRSDQCTDDEVIIPDTNHVHEIEEPIPQSKAAKHSQDARIDAHQEQVSDEVGVSMSGVVGILLLVVLVCSIGLWVLYAYRHPHSTSGQWLIRYRPSTWSWRRGEARYTAATIHM
ncbi:Plexin domain-containing protein 2 [Frankliniella fusca]|uniref:Plexin domain-containing protein 2 n=1 Tax=Frankliniella fusca TaxID=407009 RepID=A0AAE1LPN5_9NEOP|nr:Plexin domain-containing protein 2 [Frankliniella fusca]